MENHSRAAQVSAAISNTVVSPRDQPQQPSHHPHHHHASSAAGAKDPRQIMAERPSRRSKSDAGQNPQLRVVKAYTIGDSLGQGAFGKVFRGLNLKTGEVVAIKQIDKHLIATEDWPMVLQELNLLQDLIHPNIVQFIDFHDTNDYLYFILEFVEGGSLYSVVKKFGAFPDRLLVLFVVQVLRGLRYLHSKGVMHRDIKGANILLTKEGTCKLADFGSATYTAVNKKLEAKGTPFWMAPELIDESATAGLQSDIWSLGCTIIELLTGEPPYWKLGPTVALYRMANDTHPPIPEDLHPQLLDFLMKCFDRNPLQRPTADELLRHPWITSIWGEEPRSADIAPAKSPHIPSADPSNTKRLTNALGNLFKKITPTNTSTTTGLEKGVATPGAGGRARSSSNSDEHPFVPHTQSTPIKMDEALERTHKGGPDAHASLPNLSHSQTHATGGPLTSSTSAVTSSGPLSDSAERTTKDKKKDRLSKAFVPRLFLGGGGEEREKKTPEELELECNLNLSPRVQKASSSSSSSTSSSSSSANRNDKNNRLSEALSPRFMDNLIKKSTNASSASQPRRTNSDEVRKKLNRRDSKEPDSGSSSGNEDEGGLHSSGGSGPAAVSSGGDLLRGEGKKKCPNCARWAALDKERSKEREESKMVINTLKDTMTLLTKQFDCIIDRTKALEELEQQLVEIKESIVDILEGSVPSQSLLDKKEDDEMVSVPAKTLKQLAGLLSVHLISSSSSSSSAPNSSPVTPSSSQATIPSSSSSSPRTKLS